MLTISVGMQGRHLEFSIPYRQYFRSPQSSSTMHSCVPDVKDYKSDSKREEQSYNAAQHSHPGPSCCEVAVLTFHPLCHPCRISHNAQRFSSEWCFVYIIWLTWLMVSEVVSLPTTVDLYGNWLMDNISETWTVLEVFTFLSLLLSLTYIVKNLSFEQKVQWDGVMANNVIDVTCCYSLERHNYNNKQKCRDLKDKGHIVLFKNLMTKVLSFPLRTNQTSWASAVKFWVQILAAQIFETWFWVFSSGKRKQCVPKTALAGCEPKFWIIYFFIFVFYLVCAASRITAQNRSQLPETVSIIESNWGVSKSEAESRRWQQSLFAIKESYS